MPSFARMATLDCSTKRAATNSNKSAGLAANLSDLKCTPLDPITDNVMDEVLIQFPFRALQTYIEGDGLDIKKGDWLSVDNPEHTGTVDYPIQFVAPWTWRKTKFLRLVLEDRTL